MGITLQQFWEAVGYVFALNAEAFRIAVTIPGGGKLALIIVLLAGLSQEIGQSIILFVNQVKPLRFVLSLLINSLLYAGGFLALVFSTWLITLLPGVKTLPLGQLATVLGVGYVPLLFSFMGALPHLGYPLLNLLSIWHLLAMVVGFGAIAQVDLPQAALYVGFGWIMLQLLQQTLGRPLANLSRRLANLAAGVDLVRDRQQLRQMFQADLESRAASWQSKFTERLDEVRQDVGAPAVLEAAGSLLESVPTPKAVAPSTTRRWRQWLAGLLLLAASLLLFGVVLAFMQPLRQWLFGWYYGLPRLLQFVFNLVWISVAALVFAGLLAPLETLGWWAGWYDDEVNTTLRAGELAEPRADTQNIKRYIVYLDGISKSNHEYLSDIEEFLDTLTPTLPSDVALLRGIMPYSVVNRPLDEDRPMAFFWRRADQVRAGNPASILGLLINIRNVLIVGISADKRYGPLYNLGIAQVVFNGLLKNGYQPGSGVPITYIGYSGGSQMSCASAPYLKQALGAPIEVISLGGVISANVNLLKLEHLYHLVGEKDVVEPLGPLLFPGRRRFFPLSYWNRAMRRGKISQLSMGPVGHQVPGGILCPDTVLADGRSSLQQTIDKINAILRGDALLQVQRPPTQSSHYALYQSLPFVRPDYYRLHQSLDPTYYQPIGEWMGRLILPQPEERQRVQGCWFEVYHSPAEHKGLRGQVVMLQFRQDRPQIQKLLAAVTRDVHFDADALYTSEFGGLIHPERVNHWRQVNPLESLAGAHPADDMRVMLSEVAVVASASGPPRLLIERPPVEITGRFYGLVQFVAPVEPDCYQVRHFNRASRRFDGPSEVVSLPPVHLAEAYGSYPSSSQRLEASPCNERGWYIYGAQDQAGRFVVQSLAPRSLFQLQPDRVVFGGAKPSYRHIRQAAWREVKAQKGQVSSVLCTARDNGSADAISAAIAQWHEGDRALVLHTYGGIGGNKAEPSAAAAPIFFGHFAYGVAQVVRDPLADELRFEINYHQVYTHNSDGLIAGTLHWSRYMGDRQFGWLGTRPTCDLVVKLDCFTGFYDFYGTKISPLARMEAFLAAMMARYRIGDGTGGTYVGPANNCSQDANQALFASIQQQQQQIEDNAELLQRWAADSPEQIARFEQLKAFGHDLKQALQPLGRPRQDWQNNEFTLGSTLEDEPLRNLALGLSSWRTLLPRKASDTVVRVFLKYGGSAWVLRTTQVGGVDADIEPIAPITL